jgi:orotate phosphoribosyltransferase
MISESLERDRLRLLELLKQLSFEKRKVTLTSGKESDFYIDCKRTALTAEGHFLIGRLLFAEIRRHGPEVRAVGGLTLGADPLVSAVSLTSYLAGQPLAAFIVRKEAKEHGTEQWIEGAHTLEPGSPVAIVEDVVTSGGSTLKAIQRAELHGFKVSQAFALVDRLEGGRGALEAKGYRLVALYTRNDFL